MSRPTNKPPTDPKPSFPHRKSGRAAFEADGRSIWEWQTATGVFERNATAEQVAKLEDTTLAIVEDSQASGNSIYGSVTPSRAARTERIKSREPSVLSRLLKRFGRH